MTRRWMAMAVAMSLVLGIRCTAATPEEIDAALVKAKAFLYSKQKHGNWEIRIEPPTPSEALKAPGDIDGGQWGEQTALATYALLALGDSPQSDKLAPAIKFLETTPMWGTYALAAKTQIYPLLPPSADVKKKAAEDLKKLLAAQFKTGAARGFYDLMLDSTNNKQVDHSYSEYGVLGVLACEQAGLEVPNDYWKTVEEVWIDDTYEDGAWGRERPYATGTSNAPMTAAALMVLFVTQDRLHADSGLRCNGNITNPHIQTGLEWLSKNFDAVTTYRGKRYAPNSSLFDVEEVGRASGLKYLGTVNWYDVGADFLLKSQKKDGSWGRDIPSACYAMLFLSHGRAPVAMNKLQYNIGAAEGNWNERPRDAANLVHYVSQEIERDLSWQIVNLAAPLPELHEAPILYLAGNQSLQFTAEQQAKLKQFCEEGGILLGNADCGKTDFATSFRQLGSKLFPNYEFRELPADHPIYTNEQYRRSQWKNPPVVLGLGNGVREMLILFPDSDPARYWQLQQVAGREEFYQLTDDIFLYAVDKQNLLAKGKTYLVNPDANAKTTRRIKLARLQYEGNSDPEPAGWRRLSAILRNDSGIRLDLLPIKLGTNKLGNGHGIGAHVAHLTGTTRLKLDDASRAELKKFVDGGGTLIVDAAGGSPDFADSAQSELAQIFGDDVGRQLKLTASAVNPVFNLPGGKISEFNFRSFAGKIVGAQHGPQLRIADIEKRPAIFFSREDLSAGLVGEQIDGIVGYDPATATAIMRNLVIFAGLGESAPVTPAPAPTGL